jgi:hypothetical protein
MKAAIALAALATLAAAPPAKPAPAPPAGAAMSLAPIGSTDDGDFFLDRTSVIVQRPSGVRMARVVEKLNKLQHEEDGGAQYDAQMTLFYINCQDRSLMLSNSVDIDTSVDGGKVVYRLLEQDLPFDDPADYHKVTDGTVEAGTVDAACAAPPAG